MVYSLEDGNMAVTRIRIGDLAIPSFGTTCLTGKTVSVAGFIASGAWV